MMISAALTLGPPQHTVASVSSNGVAAEGGAAEAPAFFAALADAQRDALQADATANAAPGGVAKPGHEAQSDSATLDEDLELAQTWSDLAAAADIAARLMPAQIDAPVEAAPASAGGLAESATDEDPAGLATDPGDLATALATTRMTSRPAVSRTVSQRAGEEHSAAPVEPDADSTTPSMQAEAPTDAARGAASPSFEPLTGAAPANAGDIASAIAVGNDERPGAGAATPEAAATPGVTTPAHPASANLRPASDRRERVAIGSASARTAAPDSAAPLDATAQSQANAHSTDSSAGASAAAPAIGFAGAWAQHTNTPAALAQRFDTSPPGASFEAPLSAALNSPEFAPALGVQLSTLVRNGIPAARLHLNPAELGPIAVQIELDGRIAQVTLAASHHETRQALEQALPQLAQTLHEAGFTMSGGGVFQPPQQRASDTPASNPDRARRIDSGADSDPMSAGSDLGMPSRVQRGVVDLYA